MPRCSRAVLGIALALSVGGSAWADSIICEVEPGACGWSISVDGVEVVSGDFVIDEGGSVGIPGGSLSMTGTDFSISMDGLSGNVDPEIGFGIGATNSSSAPKSFAFAFSLPLGGFNFGDAILTEAALTTTLTASSSSDGHLDPTLGIGKIVDSQDIVFSPFVSVDKGVDIGDALTDPAGGLSTLRNEFETGSIAAGFSFDLMSVTVAFILFDDDQLAGNPGNVGVGLSGRVTQLVPEPTTALLLAFGLVGLAVRRRRA